ncbi:SRPBCC family protein [Mariniblastus sp.]|nr:SRPBCC family protein [Mariniblastus sp.]
MYFLQRLLSGLLVLVIIAAAALWIMGGKKKENQTSLEFDASPAQIWPYLTEPNGIGQWFGGLVSVDPITAPSSEPDAAPAPPVRRIVQAPDGTQKEYKDQILRFVPQQILSLKSRSAGQTITWVYQLDAMVNDRTNVTLRVVESPSGLDRLLAPLNQDFYLDQIETDIRKLKQVVEASTVSGDSNDVFRVGDN